MDRKRDFVFEKDKDYTEDEAYKIEKKGEHRADIIIRCKRCNQFLLGYDLTYDDRSYILENVMLPPCRCTRVVRFMRYTEGFLRQQAVDGIVKI